MAAGLVTQAEPHRALALSVLDRILEVRAERAQSLQMVVAEEVRRRAAEAVVDQTIIPSQAAAPQSDR